MLGIGQVEVPFGPGRCNEHGLLEVVDVFLLPGLVEVAGEPHVGEVALGKAHHDDVLPLQALCRVNGAQRDVVVGHGDFAFHIVLLDEAGEGLPVDGEGKEEVGDGVVLTHEFLEGLKVLLHPGGLIMLEELLDKRRGKCLQGQFFLLPLPAGNVLLDVLDDPALHGVVETLGDVPAGHAVQVHRKRTADGIDAVLVVRIDDAEQMVESLDVLLDYLLAAEDLVGNAFLAEKIDEGCHVPEVLAENGRIREVIDSFHCGEHVQRFGVGVMIARDADPADRTADGTERHVLAVGEAEGVHIVAHRLRAAVSAREALPGVIAVPLEETVQMLVGAAVEPEDVLTGVSHKEDLHGRVHLEQEVEDAVVELREVLGLVDDKDGHLAAEPGTEGCVSELIDEHTEDIIDGDDVVAALQLCDELLELRVSGLEAGFQAGLDFLFLVLVVQLDAELIRELLDIGVVDDDVIELLAGTSIVGLHHLEAEGVKRTVVELKRLRGAALEGGLAEALSKFIGGSVGVGKGDNLLRDSGGADVVEKLVDEKVGLPGAGTGAHIDDLGVAQNGVLLLVIEPFQLIGTGAADELHRGLVREDPGGQVDEAHDHAVEDQIGLPVYGRVVVHHVVELVLQGECRLGHLVVLVPLVELLQGFGESAVAAGNLIVELMGDGTHGLGLVSPVTVRFEIVVFEHFIILLYPFFTHCFVLQSFAKFGFASRLYLCSVESTIV